MLFRDEMQVEPSGEMIVAIGADDGGNRERETDPVTLEVLRSAAAAIADEMSVDLLAHLVQHDDLRSA